MILAIFSGVPSILRYAGVPVEKMEHVYLGPSYSNEDVIAACAKHESKPNWRKIENMPQRIAKIMVDGNPVAWFQHKIDMTGRKCL